MVRDKKSYFLFYGKKIFDEVGFYFIRDFFAPQRLGFFMTFLNDVGGNLDIFN